MSYRSFKRVLGETSLERKCRFLFGACLLLLITSSFWLFLLERLDHGPKGQKRTILFNLWRFYSKREEVASVYLRHLDHEDAELRFDALVLLASVTETRENIPAYRKCLTDKDPRIRALALRELAELSAKDLLEFKEQIQAMVSDPRMEVKKAAIDILKKIG